MVSYTVSEFYSTALIHLLSMAPYIATDANALLGNSHHCCPSTVSSTVSKFYSLVYIYPQCLHTTDSVIVRGKFPLCYFPHLLITPTVCDDSVQTVSVPAMRKKKSMLLLLSTRQIACLCTIISVYCIYEPSVGFAANVRLISAILLLHTIGGLTNYYKHSDMRMPLGCYTVL